MLLVVIVGLLTVAQADKASAHPHVFITYSASVIFGERDIAGLRLTWTFDEMYSGMIRTDYTAAKTGAITPADVKTIEKEAFNNLANYGYFLDIKINDQPVRIAKVKDFDVKFVGQRAVYQFTVTLQNADGLDAKCDELRNERRITVLGPIQSDLVVCTYARKA